MAVRGAGRFSAGRIAGPALMTAAPSARRINAKDNPTSALPRLRLAAAVEVVRQLWLMAGVDDVLNGPRRDYYLGAMLRFNDEDLRSILPFAGGLAGAAR